MSSAMRVASRFVVQSAVLCVILYVAVDQGPGLVSLAVTFTIAIILSLVDFKGMVNPRVRTPRSWGESFWGMIVGVNLVFIALWVIVFCVIRFVFEDGMAVRYGFAAGMVMFCLAVRTTYSLIVSNLKR